MLSATATDILVLADPPTLKHPPASLPARIPLPHKPTAAAWAADNSVLYLSSARTITQYDPLSAELKDIYVLEDPLEIRCLAAKDKDVVIFSVETAINILQCDGSTAKILQALTPHEGTVVSLSLSNDSNLLAAASKNSVLVYSLPSGSHSILRNPPSTEPITVCSFHPHTRTRLLVATGRQILVYDINRPSSPPKNILMNETISGNITAIASSPFSKTLVATASSGGHVSLIDLDKEKGLFRTLNLKVPLTTLMFSPEGAAMYLGTGDGRLLIVDLRALDRPPKCVVLSELGNPIDTLCIQGKLKVPPEETKVKSTGVVNKAPRVSSSSKLVSTPVKARSARITSSTPSRKLSLDRKTGTPRRISIKNDKKVLTPSRDPLGNSMDTDFKITKSTILRPSRPVPISASPKTKLRSSLARSSLATETAQRTGTTSDTIHKPRIGTKPSNTSIRPSSENLPVIDASLSRTDNASGRSQKIAESIPSIRIHSRPTRTVSSSSNASNSLSRRKTASPSSPPPSGSFITTSVAQSLQRGTSSDSRDESRTPSPELPSIQPTMNPTTPPTRKKKGMAVLGLGTPDVKAWINAEKNKVSPERKISRNKGKEKVVGFCSEDDDEYNEQISYIKEIDSKGDQHDDNVKGEPKETLSMQISPRRAMPASTSTCPPNQNHTQPWEASPLRSHYSARPPVTPTPGNAHELLRTIVQDVMYDFQRETKAEMMGLHLDLIRMGRGWKQEMRVLMDEYLGDLNDLREENKRLREENERLRRGY